MDTLVILLNLYAICIISMFPKDYYTKQIHRQYQFLTFGCPGTSRATISPRSAFSDSPFIDTYRAPGPIVATKCCALFPYNSAVSCINERKNARSIWKISRIVCFACKMLTYYNDGESLNLYTGSSLNYIQRKNIIITQIYFYFHMMFS